jgi:cell division protein ZapA (FtsZ GTPase activity inhibitor)
MRVWSAAVVVMFVTLLSACGGSSRLSASDYRAHLRTIANQSNAAQHSVGKGFQSTSLTQLLTVLTAFGASEKRIGDEVAALKAPKDAESANSELANGQHDTASELQALLPKIKKMSSAKAAITYLSKTPTTKGGHEVDQALAKLKKLGYIKNVS